MSHKRDAARLMKQADKAEAQGLTSKAKRLYHEAAQLLTKTQQPRR